MLNFNKFNLINKLLDKYYETCSMMVNRHGVSNTSADKIARYVDKCLKSEIKLIEKEDKYYQKRFKRQYRKIKKGIFDSDIRIILEEELVNKGLLIEDDSEGSFDENQNSINQQDNDDNQKSNRY